MSDKNDIRIDVVGTIDGLDDALKAAQRELNKLKDAAAGTSDSLGKSSESMTAAVAKGSLLADAIAEVTRQTYLWAVALPSQADEVGKLAQRMGESVESVSELRYAFELAGAGTEQMAGLMKSLEVKAQDAAKGTGQAAAAYRAMGISVTDGNGALKDGRVLLEEVADKVAGYSDGAAKAALVQDALGGSWVKMIPLLNGGAEGLREAAKESHALGVVFSEDLTKQSAELNDNLTRLKFVAEAAKIALGSELLPAVRRIAEEMVQATKAADGFFAGMWARYTLDGSKSYLDNIQTVRGELAKMESDQKEYGYLDEQRWSRKQAQLKYLQAMRNDENSRGIAATLSAGIDGPVEEKGAAPTVLGSPKKVRAAKATKPDDTAHKEYLASLKDQAKAELDLINTRHKADDLLSSYAREDQMTVQRIARSAELALMTERERGAAEAVYQAEDKSFKRQKQIIDQIKDEGERTAALTAEKTQLAVQVDRVREASLASYDAQKTFDFGWTKAFQSYTDEATNAAKQGQTVFTSAADMIADAGTRLAMRQKVSFGDIAQSFAQMVVQMQMKAAAAGLVNSLGGLVKGFFSSGATMSGAGTSTENWIDSGGLAGARAGGGDVSAGKTYLVGEKGPELLRMGSSGGSVVPNEAIGGGGVVVNMSVVNQGAADGYQAQSSVRENNGKLDIDVLFVKAMQNDLKRNGPVTQGIGQTFGLNRSAA